MTKNTKTGASTINGRGLFACRGFAKGEFVEEVEGCVVLGRSTSKYAIRLSGGRSLILTNKTKYVNHSRCPNVCFNVKRGLVALADIAAGDELTSEYASIF